MSTDIAVNDVRFPFGNRGHEVTFLALKLKLVAHRLATLIQIVVSPAQVDFDSGN
jgi:hypothetical protein